jgi:hypothetical protein
MDDHALLVYGSDGVRNGLKNRGRQQRLSQNFLVRIHAWAEMKWTRSPPPSGVPPTISEILLRRGWPAQVVSFSEHRHAEMVVGTEQKLASPRPACKGSLGHTGKPVGQGDRDQHLGTVIPGVHQKTCGYRSGDCSYDSAYQTHSEN